MNEKIFGYFLLTVGIVIMFFSAFSVYRVFVGKSQPFPVFHISSVSIDFNQLLGGFLPPEVVSQTAKRPVQKTEVLPADAMNKLFNLLSTLMLYGFLLSFGEKIASLGVELIRPIKVTVREKEKK